MLCRAWYCAVGTTFQKHRKSPRKFLTVQKGLHILGKEPKLLDYVRQALRVRHYSLRTEEAYVQWIKRFILFHNKRHPREMGVLYGTR
jgi:hypothetical protein